MSNHRPQHILFWRNVKYYPKLSSNTPRLSLSRSLLASLLETYIWCIDYYMYDSFQNAKHMVWLRSKKICITLHSYLEEESDQRLCCLFYFYIFERKQIREQSDQRL